jgi:hypothetical protein
VLPDRSLTRPRQLPQDVFGCVTARDDGVEQTGVTAGLPEDTLQNSGGRVAMTNDHRQQRGGVRAPRVSFTHPEKIRPAQSGRKLEAKGRLRFVAAFQVARICRRLDNHLLATLVENGPGVPLEVGEIVLDRLLHPFRHGWIAWIHLAAGAD